MTILEKMNWSSRELLKVALSVATDKKMQLTESCIGNKPKQF
jgi:hypothetical protein